MQYKGFLAPLQQIVNPRRYIEIGIRNGFSLSLCSAEQIIAIDPGYGPSDMKYPVKNTTFYQETSDDFFASSKASSVLAEGFDLAYIDGFHNFEFALRDFINLEQYALPHSIIIVDDVLPKSQEEAMRTPTGKVWTGDVWKLIPCFSDHRPDLVRNMILVDSNPRGCLILPMVDRYNKALSDHYDSLLDTYLHFEYPLLPPSSIKSLARTESASLAAVRALVETRKK